MTRDPDFATFQHQTRGHKLTIEMDNGVHRCIHLGKPGSSAYHFRIVTWPGSLAIEGDAGSFMFSRVRDMFDFFRDEKMTNRINAQYWHEKMQAQDRRSPAKAFSGAMFDERVKEYTADWETTLGKADALRQQIEDEVLGAENEQEAWERIQSFESDDLHQFEDFCPSECEDYGWHFIWCLRAIVWGIKQYDLAKEGRTQADHDARVLKGEL